ncbi:hypothetical protein MNV49_001968 [Pseudohyphozyma bogoriensis]|nr:hypothetical protein MNV49_001968 [Pseudohyphozyma bogoriensis]
MACDLSSPDLLLAYNDVRNEATLTNWTLWGYQAGTRDRINAFCSGEGGLEEMCARVKQSPEPPFFGFFRCEGKLLLWAFLPEDIVSGVRRARALVHSRAISAAFRNDATFTSGKLSELNSLATIRHKLKLDGSTSLPPSPVPPQTPQFGTSFAVSDAEEQPLRPQVPTKAASGLVAGMENLSVRRADSPRFSPPGTPNSFPSPTTSPALGSSMRQAQYQGPLPRTSSIPKQTSHSSTSAEHPTDERSPNGALQELNGVASPSSQHSTRFVASSPQSISSSAFAQQQSVVGTQSSPAVRSASQDSQSRWATTEVETDMTDGAEPRMEAHAAPVPEVDATPALEAAETAEAIQEQEETTQQVDELETGSIQRDDSRPSLDEGDDTQELQEQDEEEEERRRAEEELRVRTTKQRDDAARLERVKREQEAVERARSTAEREARARWEAEQRERERLDAEERIRLEAEEKARREAAERLRKEEARRLEEKVRVGAEKARKEAAERARVAKEEERLMREQEALARRLREEEEAQRREEARLQEQAAIRSRFDRLYKSGEVMLAGHVTAQGGDSIYWKRRYFELRNDTLKLFKSEKDLATALDTIVLPKRVQSISLDPEEASIPNSFKMIFKDADEGDAYLFYTDEKEDKELLIAGLRMSAQLR